ncbi:short-chain dehydrogenase [Candidatus Poribacteria bacterium]|nr:MAG: short-chain dehydrogenase [Candidatus Poribacteria bacterium]
MRLKDKVAIITGAASGIGKATAKLFAEHGAKVVVADIDKDGGNQTVAKIHNAGNEAIYVQTDVTIKADTEQMVAQTVKTYGKLDILFNNAGIAMRLPVAELPEDDWHHCLNVNLTGVFLCAKAAIPAMQQNGGGSIINMSSIFGIVGADVRAAYVASKGAVTNLTRGMALDYAQDNIRVNCICPGFVETPLVAGVVRTPEEYQKLADKHPLRRLGQPEEIAYGALYLASDESAFVTGIALPIDGGYTAG